MTTDLLGRRVILVNTERANRGLPHHRHCYRSPATPRPPHHIDLTLRVIDTPMYDVYLPLTNC